MLLRFVALNDTAGFFFMVNSKYHGTVENYEIVFYFCTVQTVHAFCYPSQGTSLFDVLANEAIDGRHHQIDQQTQSWSKDQLQDRIANKGMAWPNYRRFSFPS